MQIDPLASTTTDLLLILLSSFLVLFGAGGLGVGLWRLRKLRSEVKKHGQMVATTNSPRTSEDANSRHPSVSLPLSEREQSRTLETGSQAPPTLAGRQPFHALTRKQRRALIRQAKQDYRQARGYAHLQMLERAQTRLNTQRQELVRQQQDVEQELAKCKQAWRRQAIQALEEHMIQHRFHEVPGIGPQLQTRILQFTNARRLDDLRDAHRVQGVGESRQYEINRWIDQIKQATPAMLEQSFPGRESVDSAYQQCAAPLRNRLAATARQLTTIDKQLAQLQPIFESLSAVEPDHFVKAAQGSPDALDLVEQFMLGVFPEWEPMPKWFQDLLNEGS